MESRWAVLLILALLGRCRCHIHWMVTENGKIEYQDDTPYDLRKPYDLVGFMQQEERFNTLKDMEPLMSGYGQLLKQYDNGSPERTIRTTDPHCRASMPISGYDFHISSMLPIGTQNIYESYLARYINFTPGTDKPYCHLSPLTFSMYTMDHLDSMQRRKELGTYKPEHSMTSEVRHSMDDYGHFVSKAMEKNTTSWVLFNFAAIYWRYKGDATNVLECARRALHYSPMDQKDIGLLHMASVLQRMGLLDDAATLMEVAVTFNRDNLLYHYILAGIYVTQNLFDKSLEHIEYVLTKEPNFKDGRSLWHAIYCEQTLHDSVSSYSEQYEEARDGINRYSATYSDLQKHQVIPSKFKIPGLDKLNMQSSDAHLPRVPKQHQQQKWSKESQTGSHKKDVPAGGSSVLNQTAFTDAREAAMLSQASNTSAKKIDAKETAPSNITSPNTTDSTQASSESTASKDDMDKNVDIKDSEEKTNTVTSAKKKPRGNKPRIIFHPEDECRRSSRPSSDEEELGTNEENNNVANEKESEQKASSSREEKIDKLPKQEATSPTLSEGNQSPSTSRQSSDSTGSQYTDTYQNSEFRPYNPLSHTLEERLFPRPFGPANFFDYPSWPDKTECLDVVENLSAWVKSSRMDIDMEKRGHNYEKMFLILSPNMPKRLMKTPHCYNIVELTYTMHAMDHLPAIAKRKMYNYNDESIAMQYQEFVQDKFMKHFAAKGATEVDEAGRLIYAALLKHGPNHALFSLAGFYWRIKGNVYQAIECYRRAAHFAPQLYKDIAYVALANVMLDVEALEEAVIFARAAVEIRPHELVSHYAYALTLSAIGELDGCSLHLRWVLMHDVKFAGALEYLRTVRCYVKFERERVELEKQHKQLLARQAALDKKREDLQKEFELILERADLLLDHDNVMQYIETLEEKRKEISALADIDNYEKMMFLQDNAYNGEDGSSTSKAVTGTSCKDCEQFATVNTVTGDYIEHYSGQAAIQYFSSVVMFLRKKEETALQIRNSRREASAIHRKKLSLTSEEIDALKPVTEEQLDLLSFPDDEDCEDRLKAKYLPYASTWLSLKSKGINVSDHIDFKATLNAVPELPYCATELEPSGTFNLDNLEGLRNRQKLHCPPEKHLKRILFSLYPGNITNRLLDEAGTYIKLALDRDPLTWQVANMAALYWRIVGRPDYAMDCLRIAMEYADDDNKDIALLSTANVLFKSGYVSDAIVALTVFMEISPDSVIGHFAFGNVLAIKGEHRSALYHYQSAFDLQPNFLMALDRIRTLQCILGEHRVKPYRPGMH